MAPDRPASTPAIGDPTPPPRASGEPPPEKHLGFTVHRDKPRPVKSNLLLLGPACLLALLALALTGLSFQYVQLTRELNRSQAALAQIEFRQNRIKTLVNECIDHAQRNPDLLPILQSIGIKASSSPATLATPSPAVPSP